MRYLENNNLNDEIKEGLHLVDFYADWCGPCRMLSPILEEITDIDVIKVNVDKFPSIASEYKIMSIPKLCYVKDGKVIFEQVGFQEEETIREKINELKNLDKQ